MSYYDALPDGSVVSRKWAIRDKQNIDTAHCVQLRSQTVVPFHKKGQSSHLPQAFASRHTRYLLHVMRTLTRGGQKIALQLVLHLVSSGHWHLVHLAQHEHTCLVTLLQLAC